MTKKAVQSLIEDIRLVSEQNYGIVEAVGAGYIEHGEFTV
ncbi:MAG: hypothetical protein RLZZ612_2385 [Pseudomonadota bacterium]|jgi:hypothetical protein